MTMIANINLRLICIDITPKDIENIVGAITTIDQNRIMVRHWEVQHEPAECRFDRFDNMEPCYPRFDAPSSKHIGGDIRPLKQIDIHSPEFMEAYNRVLAGEDEEVEQEP